MKLLKLTVWVGLTALCVYGQPVRVDPAFSIRLDGAVGALAVQPDGKIIVGGTFTNVNDSERRYIARLNSDGSVDDSFSLSGDPLNDATKRIILRGSRIYVDNSAG